MTFAAAGAAVGSAGLTAGTGAAAAGAAAAGTSALTMASLGLAAGGIGMQAKAMNEQKKAARAQQAIRTAEQTRQRMEQVRQQRIAQAQILQGAATQGTSEASSARGGYSAVGSRVAGNIGFVQGISNIQDTVAQRMEKAQQYQNTAQALTSAANLSMKYNQGSM